MPDRDSPQGSSTGGASRGNTRVSFTFVVSALPRTLRQRSNEWLISCKRPCENLWSLAVGGGRDAGGATRRPRLSAALAG
jgi:hypothetical protein